MFIIVFGIHCNFFIVLPARLKTCRSNIFFVFQQGKKFLARLRGFVHLSAPDWPRARNLCRPALMLNVWKQIFLKVKSGFQFEAGFLEVFFLSMKKSQPPLLRYLNCIFGNKTCNPLRMIKDKSYNQK